MPIQHAIWRVGDQPAPLASSKLASEQQLEAMIVREPRILSNEWLLIGQQEVTSCRRDQQRRRCRIHQQSKADYDDR